MSPGNGGVPVACSEEEMPGHGGARTGTGTTGQACGMMRLAV